MIEMENNITTQIKTYASYNEDELKKMGFSKSQIKSLKEIDPVLKSNSKSIDGSNYDAIEPLDIRSLSAEFGSDLIDQHDKVFKIIK